MSAPTEFTSFEEFWPFYVREHSKKATRLLHFGGTALGLAIAAYAIAKRKPKALWLAPIAGYGFAWVGHFFVEKNMPATFKHPLWSFRGDMRMFKKMLDGTMDDEVRRVLAEYEAEANGAETSTAEASVQEARPSSNAGSMN